jgi:hypothetical protein
MSLNETKELDWSDSDLPNNRRVEEDNSHVVSSDQPRVLIRPATWPHQTSHATWPHPNMSDQPRSKMNDIAMGHQEMSNSWTLWPTSTDLIKTYNLQQKYYGIWWISIFQWHKKYFPNPCMWYLLGYTCRCVCDSTSVTRNMLQDFIGKKPSGDFLV